MMKCEDVQKELEAFYSNDIDEQKKGEIQNHLNKCQNCSSINPRNYKYCRYCGNIIKVKTSEAKRKFGMDTIKRVLLRKKR